MENFQVRMRHGVIFIFFIAFFAPYFLHAQTAPKIEWQRCLGGTQLENEDINLRTIVQASDGGYVIGGRTDSDDGDVSGYHQGADDAWVVKISSLGKLEWQRCYGNRHEQHARALIRTSDNGYVFAGLTDTSNGGDVSGSHGGDYDEWVVKLDSIGNIEWQRCLGGSGDEEAYSIFQTSDRGYVVAGNTTSNDEGFFNHGSTDAYIVRLDSKGNTLWQKCYGGSLDDEANSVVQTPDGGYIFTGLAASNDGDVSGNIIAGINIGGLWVVKIDTLGKIEWQKCYGGTDGSVNEESYCIINTLGGGYAVAGYTSCTNGDVSGHHGQDGNEDAWMLKLDSLGNLLWQKCLGGSGNDIACTIIQTKDSGYAIAGSTNSNDGDVSGNHNFHGHDTTDMWVVKLNSSGNIEWQKCLGGAMSDNGFSIIQTKDGGFAVDGNTLSNDGDVSANHGATDMWVVKLGAETNAVEAANNSGTNFTWVYPNPSNDVAQLELFYSKSVSGVQFYNMMGIRYFPNYQIQNTTLVTDVHDLPSGAYIVRVIFFNATADEIRIFSHYH